MSQVQWGRKQAAVHYRRYVNVHQGDVCSSSWLVSVSAPSEHVAFVVSNYGTRVETSIIGMWRVVGMWSTRIRRRHPLNRKQTIIPRDPTLERFRTLLFVIISSSCTFLEDSGNTPGAQSAVHAVLLGLLPVSALTRLDTTFSSIKLPFKLLCPTPPVTTAIVITPGRHVS